jgi:hypothetical protein
MQNRWKIGFFLFSISGVLFLLGACILFLFSRTPKMGWIDVVFGLFFFVLAFLWRRLGRRQTGL